MRQLLRLIRYVAPYWWQLLVSIIFMAGVGLLTAFRIALVRPIMDRVLAPETQSKDIILFTIPHWHKTIYLQELVPSHFTNAWTIVAYLLVVATLIMGVADYLGTYLVNFAGFGLITDLRNDLYERLLRRSAAFFQKHTSGTLISTIVSDIEKVQSAMSTVLAECIQQSFILIFTAILAIILGGKLSWVLVIFVPIIVFSIGRIGRDVRRTTRKGQDKLAEIQNILQETIAGNRIVKAFGMELWETLRFRGAAKRLFSANIRSVAVAAISSPLMQVLASIAISLLLLLGRDRISHRQMSSGVFFAFIIAVFALYDPVRKYAGFYNSFQQALGASESIFNFMDEQDEVLQKPNAVALKPFSSEIVFDNVSFSYGSGGDEREVLSGLNLHVPAGELLAIVGSSGSGKTTMVHLIPRFFDVTGGAIVIDGHDLRDVTLQSLRSQIGIVTQETILFNDTVRNNIAYGQPNVSQEKVAQAAHAALAHDFIMNMPEGYDTMIGERGFRLSGGERQRISIARALLKNAPILILDEATSALDAESEALVQAALQNLMANRTVFVIAHRLSTVRRADRIVVLENGQISDIGTHEDLMNR
ncbi:MAG TPA: ABC transporter transmembrane domain-containing protein, partial [Terriglobales bacterium]|nr:ABC transporter transmembrane domain-containing protein [Terriglobales bacterium]